MEVVVQLLRVVGDDPRHAGLKLSSEGVTRACVRLGAQSFRASGSRC